MRIRTLTTVFLAVSVELAVCQVPPAMAQVYERSTALVTARDSAGMVQFLDSLCMAGLEPDGRVLCSLLTARWYRHNGRQVEAHRMFDSLAVSAAFYQPYLQWLLHYQYANLVKSMQLYDLARKEANLARLAAVACKMPDEALEMELLQADIDLDDGYYARAISSYASLLEKSRALDQQEGACRSLIGIGNTHYYQEQDQEALKFYRQALELAQSIGNEGLIISSVLNIGATLGYIEGPAEAIELNRSVLDTVGPSFPPRTKADLLVNTASLYTDLGNDQAALATLDQALALYGTINDTISMATANLFKATALWHLDEREAALEQVLLCRQRTSETDLRAKSARKAADFLFAMGREKEAYEMLVESAALSDTLARRKFGKEIATAQIRFDTATKDRQITDQEQALKLGQEEHRRRSLQRNLAIGSALALVVLSLLLWRALQSRRRLAQQEEELHAKRVDELMHEHEIDAIDRMLEGQEKERDRVAKDLHDHLGSMLSAIKHQLGAVESEVAEVRQDQGKQYTKMHSMLDEAVGEVRRISHDMITVTLSRFGLDKALEDLCDSVRVKGRLDVELRHFGIERRMQRSMEIAVYRIVQEAISNMLKYADATELSVDVTRGPGHISVIVHDNGKGFDPQTPSMGIGLANMRHRAAAIGAILRVESTLGKGTTVSVEGPVAE